MFKRTLPVVLFASVLAGVMLAIRFLLIEPDAMAVRCTAEQLVSLTCRARNWAIQGFAQHLYGPISLAAGVLGWIGGSTYLCLLAMIVGMAGVVLYDFEYAAMGLLLGALFLVQPSVRPEQPQQSQS